MIAMKNRYRIVQVGSRGGVYYYDDTRDGTRRSLRTTNRQQAQRLVHALNEADAQPAMTRRMGLAYLAAADPAYATRTWQTVMRDIVLDKKGPTLHRYQTALKDQAFTPLTKLLLVETRPEDFLSVVRAGTVSTNVYLRRLQNHALDMGWLPAPVLPKKKFPKVVHGEKRAITADEHARIVEREKNPERRNFYELCWHLGGSQSDIAGLHAEDIDRERKCFVYSRRKTGRLGGMRLGPAAWAIIETLPTTGPLFPYLITVREADRATEFKQRCAGLGIAGVTLHSYRYSWAERSADAGYPERLAQRALGQASKMVHRAYAKRAQGELPSLEEFENSKPSGTPTNNLVPFPALPGQAPAPTGAPEAPTPSGNADLARA
jgi:integrase